MLQKIHEDGSHDPHMAYKRVALVVSTYHNELTESMAEECRKVLESYGLQKENITVITAPGSWELPLIVQHCAKKKIYDGIVTFGVLLKGETYHFDMIANEVARALMQTSLTYELPVIFEVLAVYDIEDATKRATGVYNKGIEAAHALVHAIRTLSE